MYYPVTDDAIDIGSYEQFAESYFPTAKAMAWAWEARNLLGARKRHPQRLGIQRGRASRSLSLRDSFTRGPE
jgi:hypothetical protein